MTNGTNWFEIQCGTTLFWVDPQNGEGRSMPLDFSMKLLAASEFILWAAVGFFFWRNGLQRRFPAMSSYLALRIGSMPIQLAVLYWQAEPWAGHYFPVYFFAWWSVYIASSISLFFVMLEIFRSALSAFVGLIRLGTVAFRWVAIVSLIVSLATMSFKHSGIGVVPDVAVGLMRSVSMLELCLLAFLCLCMNTLRLSVKDFTFGLALGFGVMALNDFVQASVIFSNTSLNAPMQYVNEGVTILTLTMWVSYCAAPVLTRKPVTISANSTIYRWNEIAAALGHGTHVAVQQSSGSFFLADVEKVVDKVLTRSMPSSETK